MAAIARLRDHVSDRPQLPRFPPADAWRAARSVGTYADIMALTVKRFERRHLFGSPLPVDGWSEPSPGEWAADQYWQSSLHGGKKAIFHFR